MGPGSPFRMDVMAASCCSSALERAPSVMGQLSCPRRHKLYAGQDESVPGILAGTLSVSLKVGGRSMPKQPLNQSPVQAYDRNQHVHACRPRPVAQGIRGDLPEFLK
jgi:hypothetical protein